MCALPSPHINTHTHTQSLFFPSKNKRIKTIAPPTALPSQPFRSDETRSSHVHYPYIMMYARRPPVRELELHTRGSFFGSVLLLLTPRRTNKEHVTTTFVFCFFLSTVYYFYHDYYFFMLPNVSTGDGNYYYRKTAAAPTFRCGMCAPNRALIIMHCTMITHSSMVNPDRAAIVRSQFVPTDFTAGYTIVMIVCTVCSVTFLKNVSVPREREWNKKVDSSYETDKT